MGSGHPGDNSCRPRPAGLPSRSPPSLPVPLLPPLVLLPSACSSAIWLRSSQFSMVLSRQHRVTSVGQAGSSTVDSRPIVNARKQQDILSSPVSVARRRVLSPCSSATLAVKSPSSSCRHAAAQTGTHAAVRGKLRWPAVNSPSCAAVCAVHKPCWQCAGVHASGCQETGGPAPPHPIHREHCRSLPPPLRRVALPSSHFGHLASGFDGYRCAKPVGTWLLSLASHPQTQTMRQAFRVKTACS